MSEPGRGDSWRGPSGGVFRGEREAGFFRLAEPLPRSPLLLLPLLSPPSTVNKAKQQQQRGTLPGRQAGRRGGPPSWPRRTKERTVHAHSQSEPNPTNEGS